MDLCVSVNEEREYGVVACVNAIIMSDVLYDIGLAESASVSVMPCTSELHCTCRCAVNSLH
jgi:hypothetical protein